jgi:hypothetical protein
VNCTVMHGPTNIMSLICFVFSLFQAVALMNHNIVDGSVFFRRCLLPALHESVRGRSWSLLLVWLETLRVSECTTCLFIH